MSKSINSSYSNLQSDGLSKWIRWSYTRTFLNKRGIFTSLVISLLLFAGIFAVSKSVKSPQSTNTRAAVTTPSITISPTPQSGILTATPIAPAPGCTNRGSLANCNLNCPASQNQFYCSGQWCCPKPTQGPTPTLARTPQNISSWNYNWCPGTGYAQVKSAPVWGCQCPDGSSNCSKKYYCLSYKIECRCDSVLCNYGLSVDINRQPHFCVPVINC